MRQFIQRKLRERSGLSETLSFIFAIFALLSVFYVLMMAYPPFVMKANVTNLTNQIVREISIEGEYSDQVALKAQEWADGYGITNYDIIYDGTEIDGTDHIQIRDPFTVRVETNVDIVIFDGELVKPIKVAVPIASEKAGISEVLWK